tara:strand:+ start:50 stop:499 length:450 start_codon:yes stop_codon:yes gene_type:complete
MNCLSIKTKFGWITAFEKNKRIEKVKFSKCKKQATSKNLKIFKKNLLNFFNKKQKKISSNFLINGNPTQVKIWKELTSIKFGKTKSYSDVAKKFKLSPRLVGKICGQNKLPLLIPCHRVIRSDGSLGGFSAPGGIKLKKKLLIFENKLK